MLESLRSLGLEIVEMRRPSGPCNSTVSAEVFWWQFVSVVIVDRYVAVRERSGSVLREPCGFPCSLEGDV